MPLFGDDPKDMVIEELRSERDYLRAKVDELQKELLAMTSTSAYRLVHQPEVDPPGAPLGEDLFSKRSEPYKPRLSQAQVKANFGGES